MTRKKVEALMNDAGIVRKPRPRSKARLPAPRLSENHGRPRLPKLLWDHVGGKPKVNAFKTTKSVPGINARFDSRISKDLASRGFKFVGPTIVYAFMQATGMSQRSPRHLPLPR